MQRNRRSRTSQANLASSGSHISTLLEECIIHIFQLLPTGFEHSLVCTDWLRLAKEALLVLNIKHIKQPRRPIGRTSDIILARTLSQYPGLRSLEIHWGAGLSFDDNLPGIIAACCPHLEVLQLRPLFGGSSITTSGMEVLLASLPNLRGLRIPSCESLVAIPPCFANLRHLEVLDLTVGAAFSELPDSIGDLKTLVELSIWGQSLSSLPSTFGKLSSLRKLTLNCPHLKALPESLRDLPRLESLDVNSPSGLWEGMDANPSGTRGGVFRMRQVESVASWVLGNPAGGIHFGQLETLRQLHIFSKGLRSLPSSLGSLSLLERLSLRCENLGFDGLHRLFGLVNARLTTMKLTNCRHLSSLPDSIGKLQSLEHFTLLDCEHITGLPESFGSLIALKRLRIEGCQEFRALPSSFGTLSSLRELTLVSLRSFILEPHSLARLRNLRACILMCGPEHPMHR
eukprot:TRINITY_DN35598_c0_g1_i1.p1 TRINITY_DN35598_c0_g1~~TRINITY_DN35598_c0_g1_i1.p1  ORF type:complete len:457 (-),score=16.57 TRINITY_DN35598_c0_g1_i1:305-1675(-)